MRARSVMFALAVFVLVPIATSGCSTNPLTGKPAFMLLTVDEEIQLGREAGPEIEKEFGGRYDDPVIDRYVQTVGRKLAAVALESSFPYQYTFTVLDSDVINAFALPGGPVYVTRGLLMELSDESQLAGVLGHECTHIAAQHSAKRISSQLGAGFILSVLSSAAGGGGESAGSTTSGGNAVEGLAQIVAGLVSLKYSRDDETEADTYGVDFMVRAGYQPEGLVRVMQMFEEKEQEAGAGGFEFLRTHPNPGNRIENIRGIISDKHPSASTDPRLTVGRDAYQQNVLSRLGVRSP